MSKPNRKRARRFLRSAYGDKANYKLTDRLERQLDLAERRGRNERAQTSRDEPMFCLLCRKNFAMYPSRMREETIKDDRLT